MVVLCSVIVADVHVSSMVAKETRLKQTQNESTVSLSCRPLGTEPGWHRTNVRVVPRRVFRNRALQTHNKACRPLNQYRGETPVRPLPAYDRGSGQLLSDRMASLQRLSFTVWLLQSTHFHSVEFLNFFLMWLIRGSELM